MKKIVIYTLALLIVSCASAGTNFRIADANKLHNGMTKDEVIKVMQVKPVSASMNELVWSYGHANLFTGSVHKSVSVLFDDNGLSTKIPANGYFGDIDTQGYK
jgi:hypothetical protein